MELLKLKIRSICTLNIKIIEAGEGSVAKYKWWFSDENEPQPAIQL